MTDFRLRPQHWDEYIGQENLKHALDVAIESALHGHRAMHHVLLHGAPGCGKSTIADLIAVRLGDPIIRFVRRPTLHQFVDALLGDGSNPDFHGGGVCFIDEVHRWEGQQEDLLQLLEDHSISIDGERLEFPHVTLICDTTARDEVLLPLLKRLAERTFDVYTDDESARIVLGMAERASAAIVEEEAVELGRAAGGVPERAGRMVSTWRDLEIIHGFAPVVEEVLELCECEPDGLSFRHLAMLHEIDQGHGRTGPEGLASRLRLHIAEVRELEKLLFERGLVEVGDAGASLTPSGRSRLAEGGGRLPVRQLVPPAT